MQLDAIAVRSGAMNDEPPIVTIDQSAVVRRNEGTVGRLGRASVATLIALCLFASVASALLPTGPAPGWVSAPVGLMFIGSMLLLALAAVGQLSNWFAARKPASVTASDRGVRAITARSTEYIARSELDSGWLVRDRGSLEVELRKKNGDIVSVAVQSDAQAHALFDALGIAPDKRATSMQLGAPALNALLALASLVPSFFASTFIAIGLGSLVSLPSATLGFLLFALTAAGMPLSLWLFAPPRVHVGVDGVSVGEGARQWFVAFKDLTTVSASMFSIKLVLRDGRTKSIPCVGTDRTRVEALVQRIREGIVAASAERPLSDRLALLDRNGRSIAEWEASLRTVLDDKSAYRSIGLTRRELLDVIDDPHAPAERRIAAAFVLAQSSKTDTAERVRVAVEATAQEHVRVALERASQGSLDEASIDAAANTRVHVAD